MSDPSCNLKNHFLIAMPQLLDANFSNTLIYICDHDEQGALGLVINQPMPLELADITAQLGVAQITNNQPIHAGGPVETERGFVLHTTDKRWEDSLQLSTQVALSTSRQLLQDIARGLGPTDTLIALGYAGWGAGQLEQEMAANAWLSCAADIDILFHTPAAEKLSRALRSIGIQPERLSRQTGHA